MNHLLAAFTIAALTLSSCSSPPEPDATDAIDSIVVTYSPSGDLDAADVQRLEIRDPATITKWTEALAEVPELPARGIRYIRFLPPISQHRIELRSGDQSIRVCRMRSGQLDVAAHEGWAFYSGEDAAFTALVTAALPGGD